MLSNVYIDYIQIRQKEDDMKFEINEDTVIRLSAISHAVSGVHAIATPNEFQDVYLSKGKHL